jgi:flagellar protein FliO/FliZ
MDVLLYIKFLSGFVFVIALMLLLSWVLKKAGGVGGSLLQKSEKRLKVIEFLPLDHKHRLVLVRRDNREHLLLIGPESETVIESGIIAADNDDEHVATFARDQRNVKI